ncbi:MAG: calcium-binding protein, partial [Candidatus Accumulibacter sp.]|uniref:calcium-binding protein n=1 Tax=Accumulibacter sp. TaxID=2053492 RepID=UPI001A5CA9D6
APSGVTVSLATGAAQATGGAGTDTLIGIENLTGSSHNDSLTGNSAANRLDGGAGADTLIGGDGSDTYYVDNVGDLVIETNAVLATGGDDTVYSSLAAYTLTANVETLRLVATGAADGSGNSLNNTLYAGAGNNVLNGGAGIDTVSYSLAAAAVTVSLASSAAQATGGSGSDILVNIENLVGSAYNDRLTGDGLANRLDGGGGNDTLNGGAGADTLIGGDGSDIYYVDNVGDSVVELADQGNDIIYSSVSWALGEHVERLYLTGSATTTATGNTLANTLYGHANSAANVLAGGLGNDIYYLGAGDSAVEDDDGGTDSVYTYADYTLAANVEHLYLNVATAATLTGNTLANSLRGNAGDDTLIGLSGNDTLTGGDGNDIIRFDSLLNALTNVDTITDYNVADDTIHLENAIFTALTTTGTLAAEWFRWGAVAVDADDYIIYDGATGALYYDADGNGVAAAVQFAALSGAPTLTHADFLVT